MSLAYVEYRSASGHNAIAHDITLHAWSRLEFGKSLVITTDPDNACYAMQKHWQRLCRRLADVRIDTDTPARMIALSKQVARLQQTQITSLLPSDRPQADIFLLTAQNLDDLLPEFATLYITCEVPHTVLNTVVEAMPAKSLVVMY